MFFVGWPVWFATIVVSALGPQTKTAYVVNLIMFSLVIMINLLAVLMAYFPTKRAVRRLGEEEVFGCVKCQAIEEFAGKNGINLIHTWSSNQMGDITLVVGVPSLRFGAGNSVPAAEYSGSGMSRNEAKDEAYGKINKAWLAVPAYESLYTSLVSESPDSLTVGAFTERSTRMNEHAMDSRAVIRPSRGVSPAGRAPAPALLACAVSKGLLVPTAKYAQRYSASDHSLVDSSWFTLGEGDSDIARAVAMGRVIPAMTFGQPTTPPTTMRFTCRNLEEAMPYLLNGYRPVSITV